MKNLIIILAFIGLVFTACHKQAVVQPTLKHKNAVLKPRVQYKIRAEFLKTHPSDNKNIYVFNAYSGIGWFNTIICTDTTFFAYTDYVVLIGNALMVPDMSLPSIHAYIYSDTTFIATLKDSADLLVEMRDTLK